MGRFAEKAKSSCGQRQDHHLSKKVNVLQRRKSFASQFSENTGNSGSTVSPFKAKKKGNGQKIKLNKRHPKDLKVITSLKENYKRFASSTEGEDEEDDGLSVIPEDDEDAASGDCSIVKDKTNFIQNSSTKSYSPITFHKYSLSTKENITKKSDVQRESSCSTTDKTEKVLCHDKVLRSKDGGRGPTILWIPTDKQSLALNEESGVQFSNIIRTVHLYDAFEICYTNRMAPKQLVNYSSLSSNYLKEDHPCSKLRVLWFGADICDAKSNAHNWYGNVQFSLPTSILAHWKHCFLVEMVTTPTHTATRLLMTNTDYSDVLPAYDQFNHGSPWYVKEGVHYTLGDCLRFGGKGVNRHGHILEFLVEASVEDEMMILEESELSFVNHRLARNMKVAHVCHRHQRSFGVCPTPFSAAESARQFFSAFNKVVGFVGHIFDNFSPSAKKLYRDFMKEEFNKQLIAQTWDSPVLCTYDDARATDGHPLYFDFNFNTNVRSAQQSGFSINYGRPCVQQTDFSSQNVCGNDYDNIYQNNRHNFSTDRSMCVKEWYSNDEQYISDTGSQNTWSSFGVAARLRF